ncbi:MAG: phosphopantetheine-binding protein, partial [Bacteroidota bacterium]
GHSLSVTRLATEIKRTMGFNLPVKTFFTYPTIDQLQAYLQLINRQEDDTAFVESEVFEL